MQAAGLHEHLNAVWQSPSGIRSITAVNHRVVGKRYIVTALCFFVVAMGLALTMLVQLSRANQEILPPDIYNQFFTMHGILMMFLFAVPMMEGIGVYLLPLMIGSRDAAYPRLNAFGYWVYLFAGITLLVSLAIGSAPNQGWFSYVPLAGPEFSPGMNVDFYGTAVTFLEIAGLVAAVEIIATMAKLRAPGMTIGRIPVFAYAIFTIAVMIAFAMPPLIIGSLMLELDRVAGTHFYDVAAGGNVLLWQHLFWWFGHPEVYIIVLPAFGIVSTIIPVFSRRRLAAYTPVVLSIFGVGIISFGLWVHHMFAVQLSLLAESFFSAASMAIAIPSGIQVFAWIGTIWAAKKLVLKIPFLWMAGFIPLFVVGGITGVMVASIPFDTQVTDSQFVTAHFHYVLIGGAVFPVMGALYYWWPKITGKMLSDKLGKISFWVAFVGFNVTFFVMHYNGFRGMPRRVATYNDDLGWGSLMLVSAIGAFILVSGFLITLVNLILSRQRPRSAGNDPWGGDSLEWSTTSPPQQYNFLRIPIVRSRTPMWDEKRPVPAQTSAAAATAATAAGTVEEEAEEAPEGYTLAGEERETIGSTPLDATPTERVILPAPSLAPFLLAIAATLAFLSPLIHIYLLPIGLALIVPCLVLWFWPDWMRGRRGRLDGGPAGSGRAG